MPNASSMPPTAEVADQVERRRWRRPGASDVGLGARQRDVVDVVPGALGQRTGLAPSGHASVHEPGVDRRNDLRSEPEPLGHAGPETFDQHVGRSAQIEEEVEPALVLEVDRDAAAPAVEDVEVR
jgi:hypothetical protein